MPPFSWLAAWWRWWNTPLPLGLLGEREAAKYLRRKGYLIVATHRYDHRLGEIDIIAIDQRTIVFVEVKTRASQRAGHPSEAVDQKKRQRMQRVALKFLKRKNLLESAARFDVVAITWPDRKKPPTIEHFKNAFEAEGRGQMFH